MKITRTCFCSNCESYRRPRASNLYVLYGGSGNIYYKEAKIYEGCVPGYTPHLIELVKAQDEGIIYDSTCLMHGCGVKIEVIAEVNPMLGQEVERMVHKLVDTQRYTCSKKQWNALVSKWKDTDYEI